MSRISRTQYLINEALNAAKRSTCLRLQVGAILAREGRPVAAGYNGALPGFPHCTPQTCNKALPCVNTVHAEANCIYFAARHGIATEGTWLYTTDSPCLKCAEAIISAGIDCVVFARKYRDESPIHLLQRAHIGVSIISPENGELCAP